MGNAALVAAFDRAIGTVHETLKRERVKFRPYSYHGAAINLMCDRIDSIRHRVITNDTTLIVAVDDTIHILEEMRNYPAWTVMGYGQAKHEIESLRIGIV